MSFLDDSRTYLKSEKAVIESLVPERCGSCAVASEIANEVIEEARSGELFIGEIGREIEMRLNTMCPMGLMEISGVEVCLVEDEKNTSGVEFREEIIKILQHTADSSDLPTLKALD